MRFRIVLVFCFIVGFFFNSFGQDDLIDSPDEYVLGIIELAEKEQVSDTIILINLKEALRYEDQLVDETLLKLYNALGNKYTRLQSNYISLTYFYKALEVQTRINSDKTFFIESNIGGAYYNLGNREKARILWERALEGYEAYQNKNPDDFEDINLTLVHNNLAVLEMNEGNLLRSLEMLKRFKKQNLKLRDTLNIIMAHENLASVYLKLGQTQEVTDNLYAGLKLANLINSEYDLASLYNELGNFYLDNNKKKDSCIYYLNKSFLISKENNFLDLELAASERLVTFYEKENDKENALKYLHTAKSLSERSIEEANTKKITLLEFEFNQKMEQHELLLSHKKQKNILLFIITSLFLFSISVLLMFKLQKSKAQKRKIESELLEKEIVEDKKTITNNTIQMLQSKEVLKLTEAALKELKPIASKSVTNKLTSIINDLKNGTKAFNKIEFEKTFMETDKTFYKELLNQFPGLTKNEIRLCALLKLNLSSKEIAAITQKTPHSIVVARTRLRKKLTLEKGQNIASFLNQL